MNTAKPAVKAAVRFDPRRPPSLEEVEKALSAAP